MYRLSKKSVLEFFPRVCMQAEMKVTPKLPSKRAYDHVPIVSFPLKVAKDFQSNF